MMDIDQARAVLRADLEHSGDRNGTHRVSGDYTVRYFGNAVASVTFDPFVDDGGIEIDGYLTVDQLEALVVLLRHDRKLLP